MSKQAYVKAYPQEFRDKVVQLVQVGERSQREELVRLRRENKRLQQEREMLSKAAAWFARESDAIP